MSGTLVTLDPQTTGPYYAVFCISISIGINVSISISISNIGIIKSMSGSTRRRGGGSRSWWW